MVRGWVGMNPLEDSPSLPPSPGVAVPPGEAPLAPPYTVIYADPPWSYRDKRDSGSRRCGGALPHYPTIPFSDLRSLPVSSIACPDSYLFLWATMPLLQEALSLVSAWGFTYKTVAFTWLKTNPRAGTPFLGIGAYTRSNAEVCLLGVRGKPPRIGRGISSIVISPREGHSKKPDIVRSRIIELAGDVPRIELFARKKTPGWDSIGFEVGSEILSTLLGLRPIEGGDSEEE